jgi:AraC-like DNA-binding protein/DNA-binding CsgD family transcriptional regulator
VERALLGASAVAPLAWTNDIERLRSLAVIAGFDARVLADHFGISERQLRRHFRAALGASPQRWLKQERLRTARAMLASSSSVKYVAYELGFRHLSQFCRDYQLQFGCPPSCDLGSASQQAHTPCRAPFPANDCRSHGAEGCCTIAERAEPEGVDEGNAELGSLTRAELAVLKCLVGGCSNREIASELTISTETVRTHVGRILGKLAVPTRAKAVSFVLEVWPSFGSDRRVRVRSSVSAGDRRSSRKSPVRGTFQRGGGCTST